MQDASIDIAFCISSFLHLREAYSLLLTCRSFSQLTSYSPFYERSLETYLNEDIENLTNQKPIPQHKALAASQKKKNQYLPPKPTTPKKLKRKQPKVPQKPKFNYKQLLEDYVTSKIQRDLEILITSAPLSKVKQPGEKEHSVWNAKWQQIITFAKPGSYKWKILTNYALPANGRNVLLAMFHSDLSYFAWQQEEVGESVRDTMEQVATFLLKFPHNISVTLDAAAVASWAICMSDETFTAVLPSLKELLNLKLQEQLQVLLKKQQENEEYERTRSATTTGSNQDEEEEDTSNCMDLGSVDELVHNPKNNDQITLPFVLIASDSKGATTHKIDLCLQHGLSDPIYYYKYNSIEAFREATQSTTPTERLFAHHDMQLLPYRVAQSSNVEVYKQVRKLFKDLSYSQQMCSTITQCQYLESVIELLEEVVPLVRTFPRNQQIEIFHHLFTSSMHLLYQCDPDKGWRKCNFNPVIVALRVLNAIQPLPLTYEGVSLSHIIIQGEVHYTFFVPLFEELHKFYTKEEIQASLDDPFSNYSAPVLLYWGLPDSYDKFKYLVTNYAFKSLADESMYSDLPMTIATRSYRLSASQRMELLELLHNQGCNILATTKSFFSSLQPTSLLEWSQQQGLGGQEFELQNLVKDFLQKKQLGLQ